MKTNILPRQARDKHWENSKKIPFSQVPIALGDCTVTIAATVELPATLVFLHPIHNFALVRFDAKSIAVRAPNDDTSASGVLPSARLSEQVLQPGDEVEFIGLSARRTGSVVCQTTCLTEVRAFEATEMPTIPRFCAVNEDVFCFDELHLDSLVRACMCEGVRSYLREQ